MRRTLRDIIDSSVPLAGIRGAVAKKASPLATSVANHLQDPVASTKDTFADLTQKKLAYKGAQDTAKLQLAPVKSFIQQAEQQHELNEDESQGYQDQQQEDPNNPGFDMQGNPMQQTAGKPGLPSNMQQQPGNKLQQNNPAANVNTPGTGPALTAPSTKKYGVPQKMGTAQPGMQSPAGSPTGQYNSPAKKAGPGQQGKSKAAPKSTQRSIKVHVAAGAAPAIRGAVGLQQIQAAVAIDNLNAAHKKGCMCAACKGKMEAGGPGSGRHAEFGTFKKTGSNMTPDKDGNYNGHVTHYEGKKGSLVDLHDHAFRGVNGTVRFKEGGKTVKEVPRGYAATFARERYGIRHYGTF